MKAHVIATIGTYPALFGLGLSYGITSNMTYSDFLRWDSDEFDKFLKIANTLAHKQGGHNKFLESITISLDITAPRYWWSEFDTYRVGVTKQSESTIHTLTKRELTEDDFEYGLPYSFLHDLNEGIDRYKCAEHHEEKEHHFRTLKALLPESFLQRRIVTLNAKTLQNIIAQRINHRLPEWNLFCKTIYGNLPPYTCSWVFPEGYTPA